MTDIDDQHPTEGRTPWTINDGLPVDREHWPDTVLDRLRSFSLGSVIRTPPLFYFADPSLAVWKRTSAYTPGSRGPELIEVGEQTQPLYGLITTQTCDILEEDAKVPKRPWVQLSPVYDLSDLDSGRRGQLTGRAGATYWFHVPALPNGFWVADLRIEVPVEKGWLSQQEPIDGFDDEEVQRSLGHRLSILRERPAFAGVFVETVQGPLAVALRQLEKENPDFYRRLDLSTNHLAVGLDSHLTPTLASLLVITNGALPSDIRGWWTAWWDGVVDSAQGRDLTLHPLEFLETSQITLERWLRYTRLPIHQVSPY